LFVLAPTRAVIGML